jgi:nitroreductase
VALIGALRTTGAIRDFLPAPVPDDVIARVLDTARFAPNGGNRQAWKVVLVKDPNIRRGVRDAYLPGWYEYVAQREAGLVPFAPIADEEAVSRALLETGTAERAAPGFAEHLDRAPVMLVLLADLRALAAVDKDLSRYTFAGGASVFPFAWSILLAARDEGLGGVITTMAVRREAEVKALLGAPDELVVAAVIVLGRPVRRFTKLSRRPVAEFATVDTCDGPPLASPRATPRTTF